MEMANGAAQPRQIEDAGNYPYISNIDMLGKKFNRRLAFTDAPP